MEGRRRASEWRREQIGGVVVDWAVSDDDTVEKGDEDDNVDEDEEEQDSAVLLEANSDDEDAIEEYEEEEEVETEESNKARLFVRLAPRIVAPRVSGSDAERLRMYAALTTHTCSIAQRSTSAYFL
jgi:hypothetical protein